MQRTIRKVFSRAMVAVAVSLPLMCSHALAGRAESLIVVREQGPNSLDIQGVGTNRPAYGISWMVIDLIGTASPSIVGKGQLRKITSLGWLSERVEPKATVLSAFSEAR